MPYEYYGQRNELIVSDKYDHYVPPETIWHGPEITTNPPRKGEAVDYQGRLGVVLWIDRQLEEVCVKFFDDGELDSFPLDQFNDSESKGRIKKWYLH